MFADTLLLSVTLTLEQWRVQKLRPLVCLEYLSCLSEFCIALQRIPRAIKACWNELGFSKFSYPLSNNVTGSKGCVDDFMVKM